MQKPKLKSVRGIVTLTPNPALDLGGAVDHLIPNEKSYVHDETRFPGGNAINAARMIHKMGLPVLAGGFLGGGIGQEVEDLLRREGVPSEFVKISASTRISVTVSNRKDHLQTRLSFPGPQILLHEVQELIRWLHRIQSGTVLVIGGSLPRGLTTVRLKPVIQSLQKRGVAVIMDMPALHLRPLLACRPLLIKPNQVEFQELTGEKRKSIPAVISAARKLTSRVSWVCVSSVEDGALLLNRHRAWYGQIPPIQVKTTVGAGDSMVGAMTSIFSQVDPTLWSSDELGEPLLRWGLAAAAATLITPGTQLGEFKKMLTFYRRIRVQELK